MYSAWAQKTSYVAFLPKIKGGGINNIAGGGPLAGPAGAQAAKAASYRVPDACARSRQQTKTPTPVNPDLFLPPEGAGLPPPFPRAYKPSQRTPPNFLQETHRPGWPH